MKKLKLKELQYTAIEILSRAQLKNVLGGSGGTGGAPKACKDLTCGAWNANGGYMFGTCKDSTILINGMPFGCDCSLSAGTCK